MERRSLVSGSALPPRKRAYDRFTSACSIACIFCRCRRGRGRCGRLWGSRLRIGSIFLLRLGAGDGGLLLAFDFAGRAGFFLDRCRFDPRAADEAFVELLHLEDQVGHVVADRVHMAVEQRHALALVFDLGIDLGITAEADAGLQVVHRQQMLFPGRIEDLQQQGPLHPPHFGPEVVFDDLRDLAHWRLRDRAWPIRRWPISALHVFLSQVVRSSSLPFWPVTAPSVAIADSVRRRTAVRRAAGPRRPSGWPSRCSFDCARPAAGEFLRAACS